MNGPVTEDELHALVDGRLAPGRRQAVEAFLDANPDAAASVASWRAQNEAIAANFGTAIAPPDDFDRRLVASFGRSRRSDWRKTAAALAIFVAGVAAGSFLAPVLRPAPSGYVQTLPEASRANFAIYAGEVRHPVEVGADEEAHLVGWLGKKLGRPLAAPDLAEHGLRLVGGRLVPYAGRPGAMLMYENEGGERLTVMIGSNPDHEGTNFRFAEQDGVNTFYWVEDDYGYALSGKFARDRLLAVANSMYRQQ